MNEKKKQISNDLATNEDVSNKRFLLHLNKISSDVMFVLSLSAFLSDNEQHGKRLAVVDVVQKLMTGLEQHDGCLENISYEKYRELFESINRNGDVLKICKEMYTSKISKEGRDFSLAIKTFFQWINDRRYENDTEDEMRTIRMKHKSEKNEWYRAQTMLLKEKKAMKYGEKLREYKKEKQNYEEHLAKVYRESDLNRIETEAKNKNDMSLYSEYIQNSLDELGKAMEEKQRTLVVSNETNIIEIENMNKNLLKRGMFLDVINNRYSNDMLMRYNKRESLHQRIKSKINSLETLKVNVMSMEMYLEELKEDEKLYFKREFFDKLDAIKEKIALRTISKFLIPYVNLKFKSKRLHISKKRKTKNQKK